MNGLSVVIPSRNAENLAVCVAAVWQCQPGIRIIVVDDGIDWDRYTELKPDQVQAVYNAKVNGSVGPFIFARNINIGIKAAGEDDVVLLNDDAVLETAGGFACMQQALESFPEFGMVASSCNNVGNQNQLRHRATQTSLLPREEPRTLCFISVLIPRSTLNIIGLMDERFGGIDDQGNEIYGFCDDDMSKRVRDVGLKLGICDACFVDHGFLSSSFRSTSGPRPLDPGHRQFILKHGVDNRGLGRELSPYRKLFPNYSREAVIRISHEAMRELLRAPVNVPGRVVTNNLPEDCEVVGVLPSRHSTGTIDLLCRSVQFPEVAPGAFPSEFTLTFNVQVGGVANA